MKDKVLRWHVNALKVNHTYAVFTQTMYDVHLLFKIQNKVICTTSDNGSNFVKAFQTYTWPNIEDNKLDRDDNIHSELKFIDLTEILEEGQQCSIVYIVLLKKCSKYGF